ncbi:PD-(D/E)XK nuclease family protein [Streptomyces glomeratus]|uniref:PD-(D/E)XK nuclease family protein n=1 Tax=Streptomyces glomeratus TaxID=284452 RepID=UPI001F25A069|nr:PD-(D/E)XK nuclease family protein [Streptomyces glomeratus]MCF1510414.1 PD-(D/E)XK nuclease family protein [Streptomyces glomeratus]
MLEVLGLADLERHHQKMIAWLLDPSQPHQLGERLLTSMLKRAGHGDLPAQALAEAEVLQEVEQPTGTRADIVIRTEACTLVIELKVHAMEGVHQTERLADGYAHEVTPVFVFLTLHGSRPLSKRFHPMTLSQFADDLGASLHGAPHLGSAHGHTARTAARDYLATLQRMNRMSALDDDAARLWLTHGMAMKEAEAASARVLESLTKALPGRLEQVAAQLGAEVVVRQETYAYQSERYPGRPPYPEQAAVLARRDWLSADGRLRAGVGFGYRLRKAGEPQPAIDVFKTELRPFVGVFVPDQAVYATLSPLSGKAWANKWLYLQYAELAPPPGGGNLVERLTEGVLDQLLASWRELSGLIDTAVRD